MPEVTQPIESKSQDLNPGPSECKACVLTTVLNWKYLFVVELCVAHKDDKEENKLTSLISFSFM